MERVLLRPNPQSRTNNKVQTIHSSNGSGPMFPLYFCSCSPSSAKPISCYLVASMRISHQMQLCFLHISEYTVLSRALLVALTGSSDRVEKEV